MGCRKTTASKCSCVLITSKPWSASRSLNSFAGSTDNNANTCLTRRCVMEYLDLCCLMLSHHQTQCSHTSKAYVLRCFKALKQCGHFRQFQLPVSRLPGSQKIGSLRREANDAGSQIEFSHYISESLSRYSIFPRTPRQQRFSGAAWQRTGTRPCTLSQLIGVRQNRRWCKGLKRGFASKTTSRGHFHSKGRLTFRRNLMT